MLLADLKPFIAADLGFRSRQVSQSGWVSWVDSVLGFVVL